MNLLSVLVVVGTIAVIGFVAYKLFNKKSVNVVYPEQPDSEPEVIPENEDDSTNIKPDKV